MSGRGRAVVVAMGLLAVLAGCQKTKLGKPVPNGVSLDLSSATVSADAGTLTVTAQAFQDGVALLQEPVTFSMSGLTATGGVVATSGSNARATFTFTGLTTTGIGTVMVQVGTAPDLVSTSATVTVVPGVATSLSLSIPSNATAGSNNLFNWSTSLTDAHANAITGAGISVTTNAPGAVINTNGTIGTLNVAGSWSVTAQYGALSVMQPFTVVHAAASQVQTSVNQATVAEKSGTLDISCKQMDPFGNDTFGTFATPKVTTSPASTVTMVNGTSFTASSFVAAGPATARCDDGTHQDDKDFEIVLEGTPSVVATLSQSAVEAGTGATVKLSCKEVDAFGNDAGTTFTTGDVSISPSGPSVTATSGGFTIGNLVTLGDFTATCTSPVAPNRADSDTFNVADTQPPDILDGGITGATEPLGVQTGVNADGAYAPGAMLNVHVDATDAVGVASVTVAITDSTGFATSWTITEPTPAASVSHDFFVGMPDDPIFTALTLGVTAVDVYGNVTPARNTALIVDPAAALGARPGVSIRTQFEGLTNLSPVGMVNSNGSLYLSLIDRGSGEGSLVRVDGPTTATVEASDYVAGSPDLPTSGMEFVPGGFGSASHQFFVPDQGEASPAVVTFDGSTPSDFATLTGLAASSIAYGFVGTANTLVMVEDNVLFTADPTGTVTQFGSGVGTVLSTVAFDGANNLFAGASNGDIYAIDGSGNGIDLGATDCGGFQDMLIVGNTLYGAGVNNNVCKISLSPYGAQADLSQSFNQPSALAVDAAGTTLYVADFVGGETVVYRVTGL